MTREVILTLMAVAAMTMFFAAGYSLGHQRGFRAGVQLFRPVSETARVLTEAMTSDKTQPPAESEQDRRTREILEEIDYYDGFNAKKPQ